MTPPAALLLGFLALAGCRTGATYATVLDAHGSSGHVPVWAEVSLGQPTP
jgi:hypothetical protein